MQQKVVVLDERSMSILKELMEVPGKKKKDYLFSVPVRQGANVVFREIGYNRLRRNLAALGVTPKQFRTYHGTEIFSKTFQHVISQVKGRVTPRVLDKATEEAAITAARALGHYEGQGADRKEYTTTTMRSYVDPMVVRSLYINAMNPDSQQNVEKGYRLQGRTEFQGLPVSIENKKGSVRKWYDPHEKKEGSTKMLYCYGYIRGTKGTDGDHVDVYLGPNKDAQMAFVVHQMKAPDFKKFDEDKVMLGFDSEKEARQAYVKQYDSPKFFGGITAMAMDEFKKKVESKQSQGRMLKSQVDAPEEQETSTIDGDGFHASQVTSEPPARFPHEQEFSYWLHTHPIHESEHEYEGLKQMGAGDLHEPETEHEDADVADEGSSSSVGSENIQLARPGEAEPATSRAPKQGSAQGLQSGGAGALRQNQSEVRSTRPASAVA